MNRHGSSWYGLPDCQEFHDIGLKLVVENRGLQQRVEGLRINGVSILIMKIFNFRNEGIPSSSSSSPPLFRVSFVSEALLARPNLRATSAASPSVSKLASSVSQTAIHAAGSSASSVPNGTSSSASKTSSSTATAAKLGPWREACEGQ